MFRIDKGRNVAFSTTLRGVLFLAMSSTPVVPTEPFAGSCSYGCNRTAVINFVSHLFSSFKKKEQKSNSVLKTI